MKAARLREPQDFKRDFTKERYKLASKAIIGIKGEPQYVHYWWYVTRIHLYAAANASQAAMPMYDLCSVLNMKWGACKGCCVG